MCGSAHQDDTWQYQISKYSVVYLSLSRCQVLIIVDPYVTHADQQQCVIDI